MRTECIPDLFGFAPVEGRRVVAAFDGGSMTSDAGAMLLGATDRAIDLVGRFAGCFADHRVAELTEHAVRTLVGQRVYGIALGYEDLIDHDELRHDPWVFSPRAGPVAMAVLAGKLAARCSDCAPLAGKSTLNRLEPSRPEPSRYHKISYDAAKIEGLFGDFFLEAHAQAPQQIILDPRLREGRLSTRPTTRCTGGKRGASSTAITIATATCRSTSSAAGICCRPSCARPTSTAAPGRSRKQRVSLPRSAGDRGGRVAGSCGVSHSAVANASRAAMTRSCIAILGLIGFRR